MNCEVPRRDSRNAEANARLEIRISPHPTNSVHSNAKPCWNERNVVCTMIGEERSCAVDMHYRAMAWTSEVFVFRFVGPTCLVGRLRCECCGTACWNNVEQCLRVVVAVVRGCVFRLESQVVACSIACTPLQGVGVASMARRFYRWGGSCQSFLSSCCY